MEKAFHAFGKKTLPVDRPPHDGRTLKWEYGLRPDLLAVTNVWEQAGHLKLIAAAKGAPEAIAELCRLPKQERTELHGAVDEMAQEGMRVLGVARAPISAESRGQIRRAVSRSSSSGLSGSRIRCGRPCPPQSSSAVPQASGSS